MTFLSNGDYIFPFGPGLYWLEHLFVWSFQNGAPNLEGIMRLPARLLNLLVFQIFGNVAVGYFYIFLSFIIIFAAFYYFAKIFLRVKSRYTLVVGALLFTCNPIFLGNLAKVGLVVAVALLPLMLVAIQRTFETRKLRYLLLYVVLLNVSIVHPYTLTVNLIVSGAYLLYMVWRHFAWLRTVLGRVAIVAGVGFLLNAYFILPILSVGSIDKSVLSQDLNADPINYTALVNIANTGDMVTALSLSKNVFKDFDFYNDAYMPVYFAAAFGLYLLLIGAYVLVQKYMTTRDKKLCLAFFAAFLALLVLSTGTLFNIDAIIKFMIDLPGGWMFRSPLKWQLYMPLFLVGALVITLKYMPKKWLWHSAHMAAVVLLFGMSAYITTDIYRRLFVPRHISQFATLQEVNLEHTTMLLANSDDCMLFAQDNPAVFTEFNQVIGSKDAQVKRIHAENIESVNIDSYDYIISCQGSAEDVLASDSHFSKAYSFANDAIVFYKNDAQRQLVYSPGSVFAVPESSAIKDARAFVATEYTKTLDYINSSTEHAATGLYELFGDVKPSNITDDYLSTAVTPNNSGKQDVLVRSNQQLYYKQDGQKVTISPTKNSGFSAVPADKKQFTVEATNDKEIEFRYRDPTFTYQNLIPNASFESGFWQEKVEDCNNFDEQPVIAMKLEKAQHTNGSKSLQLEAKRHIACTGPVDIEVTSDSDYMLSFDYLSSADKSAGYFVGFGGDSGQYVAQRLPRGEGWQHVAKTVHVPADATTISLLLYAYPDYTTGLTGTVLYDNFYLARIPSLDAKMFMVSSPPEQSTSPKRVATDVVSPSARNVQVTGATGPFYLAMKDTYHPQWRMELNNTKVNAGMFAWLPIATGDAVSKDDHFAINGSMNGWYVDPAKLCNGASGGCIKNADGSYDLELLIEFVPQRWVYVGSIISGATALGVFGYLWLERRRLNKKGHM